jgi:hypothetical protein
MMLLDALVVCNELLDDEKKQITAFTGADADKQHQQMAMQCFNIPGPKWAVVKENGKAVAVGGYTPTSPGAMRSWFLSTAEAWLPENYRGVTKVVRGVVTGMLRVPPGKPRRIHRLETLVLAERELTQRWYGSIGLTKESTLRNYGMNGEDAAMWVALGGED